MDVGSVAVIKDDADEGDDDNEEDGEEDADDEDDTDDDELPENAPKEKSAVQLEDGEEQDIDDDYQDAIEVEEDTDLVQLDTEKGNNKNKWKLVQDDPKRPCKKIKYVAKKKKTYYSCYKSKTKSNGGLKYKKMNIWRTEKLDANCRPKTSKGTARTKEESALSENSKNDKDDDKAPPPGWRMKYDKALGMEVMKWKVGGKWLNEQEYLYYAS